MRLVLLLSILTLAGCGYIGDPMPPALKVPAPVSDLSVTQRGSNLLVDFTIPDKTMEGLPLEDLGGLELKIGEDAVPFNIDAWSGSARTSDVDAKKQGRVAAKIPVAHWAGKRVVIGVRLASTRNRLSPWSNFFRLKVLPALATPENLTAIASAEGVVVQWKSQAPPPGIQWTVFRQGPRDAEATEMGKSSAPRFVDTGAEYGLVYKYSVQASLQTAASDVSTPVLITPLDKFPPGIPQGITALSSATAIIVTWDRNAEVDFASYRIFRALGDGPLARAAETASAATYRDTAVSTGQRYRYAVSAVDKQGNESQQSQTVEILQP